MKCKVGPPYDCTASVNQRNVIAEKITATWTSFKLSAFTVTKQYSHSISQLKNPFIVFLSILLIAVYTHR